MHTRILSIPKPLGSTTAPIAASEEPFFVASINFSNKNRVPIHIQSSLKTSRLNNCFYWLIFILAVCFSDFMYLLCVLITVL